MNNPADTDPDITDPTLAAHLDEAPSGAFALAGIAVALLLVAWAIIYLFVFLPRGPVG